MPECQNPQVSQISNKKTDVTEQFSLNYEDTDILNARDFQPHKNSLFICHQRAINKEKTTSMKKYSLITVNVSQTLTRMTLNILSPSNLVESN